MSNFDWFFSATIGNEEAAIPAAENGRNIVVVLASSSENRRKLLEQIGIQPLVYPSKCPEDLPRTMALTHFVEQTASEKAHEVFKRLQEEKIAFDIVIGCDTMISLDGRLIGKPRDSDDAFSILKSLSGLKHAVRTGVCLIHGQGHEKIFSVETQVEFGQLEDRLIRQYVATGEPMGRAGAYAIQGKGAVLVKVVHGSYSNVVGLPLFEVTQQMTEMLHQYSSMHE